MEEGVVEAPPVASALMLELKVPNTVLHIVLEIKANNLSYNSDVVASCMVSQAQPLLFVVPISFVSVSVMLLGREPEAACMHRDEHRYGVAYFRVWRQSNCGTEWIPSEGEYCWMGRVQGEHGFGNKP